MSDTSSSSNSSSSNHHSEELVYPSTMRRTEPITNFQYYCMSTKWITGCKNNCKDILRILLILSIAIPFAIALFCIGLYLLFGLGLYVIYFMELEKDDQISVIMWSTVVELIVFPIAFYKRKAIRAEFHRELGYGTYLAICICRLVLFGNFTYYVVTGEIETYLVTLVYLLFHTVITTIILAYIVATVCWRFCVRERVM